jgi:pimeloyl-ACP methyl ester carboxylesterase
MKKQPSWVDKQLFPFQSKWIEIDGHAIHYIDENSDAVQTLLFVHGTPEWSFGFRDMLKSLRSDYRCIAIDHLGFGLSDKPKSADYSVKSHTTRLTKFVGILDLHNITIVANDFGGGIAMGYALGNPGNIQSIVLFNTWMWSLKNDPHFSKPAKMIDSWLGRFLYKHLNAPVRIIMPSAFGDKKKLTKEIHSHYMNAVPDAASREALYTCALELMGASDWWESLWNRISLLEDKPFLLFWGMKDKFVPPHVLDKWVKRLPGATVIKYEDAGHFVQEEKADEMDVELRKFLVASDRLSVIGFREGRIRALVKNTNAGNG